MAQHIIGHCPVCKEELTATKLSCHNCGLELSNDFKLNKFCYLSENDLAFVEFFLQYNGNLKELQKQLKLSYPSIKKRLESIKHSLNLISNKETDEKLEPVIKQLPFYKNDSPTLQQIKQKLNESEGLALLTLPKGKTFYIYYEEYGNGLCATNLPARRILYWSVFDDVITLLNQQGGKAIKGNAMKGKLGSEELPLNSVEGYVASHSYHAKQGDSCLRMISTISSILEWAEICVNGYGYLELRNQ